MIATATIRYASPDRREHTIAPVVLTVPAATVAEGYSAEEVAEAVFSAVEAPFILESGTLGAIVQREVNALRAANGPLWGLMVGDTITVKTPYGSTALRIAPVGWEVVA